MAIEQQLSRKTTGGASFGQDATDKISLYGATPVVQAATPAAAVSATSTTTVCNAAVLEIQTALINLGIMAAS